MSASNHTVVVQQEDKFKRMKRPEKYPSGLFMRYGEALFDKTIWNYIESSYFQSAFSVRTSSLSGVT